MRENKHSRLTAAALCALVLAAALTWRLTRPVPVRAVPSGEPQVLPAEAPPAARDQAPASVALEAATDAAVEKAVVRETNFNTLWDKIDDHVAQMKQALAGKEYVDLRFPNPVFRDRAYNVGSL